MVCSGFEACPEKFYLEMLAAVALVLPYNLSPSSRFSSLL